MALVLGALVAVGGWFANGVLARRAVRRQMRVDYLLTAYRHLEAASNRSMTVDHESAIQSAISEIQLLGSRLHVDLADEFTLQFASVGSADSGPLLEELRKTLRRELQLDELPARRTWLRITRGGQWAEQSARIRARVPSAPDKSRLPHEGVSVHLADLVASDSTKAIVEAHAAVEAAIRELLTALKSVNTALSGSELTRSAIDLGVISQATAEAVNGLTIMRNLALHGGRDVNSAQAEEFLVLADAVIYALQTEQRHHGKLQHR